MMVRYRWLRPLLVSYVSVYLSVLLLFPDPSSSWGTFECSKSRDDNPLSINHFSTADLRPHRRNLSYTVLV
jgi:hypothetical protein